MSNLDSSIILGVKPPKFDTPLESQAKRATMDKLLGEQEMQRIGLEKARQGQADDAATREVFRGGGSESEILNRLRAVSPQAAMAYQKQLLEAQEKQSVIGRNTAQGEKAQWEIDKEKLQQGAAMLDHAKDPQSFETVLRLGQLNGTFKPEFVAQVLQQGYSPQLIEQLKSAGLTRAQQLENENRVATRNQTAATAPFTAGPGGVPVPNVPVQEYERSLKPGTAPHYDPERGIVVDPRTGQGTPITVGGQPVGAKPNAATQKELMTIGQQESTVDGALAAVKTTPSAFGFWRGAATMAGPVSESLAGRRDSKEEREARSYVFNIVSKVINERAGAAQSAQELARLRSFLPAEQDNADQITDKLNGFKAYLADLRKGTTSSAAPAPPTPAAAPASGDAPSMRVSPDTQAARDDDAARIRAREAGKNIDADIASLESELKRTNLNGDQRKILSRELALLKRGKELNAGGGASPGQQESKTIGRRTYVKVDGKWYEKN